VTSSESAAFGLSVAVKLVEATKAVTKQTPEQ
jgi:hypothetical protein